MKVFILTFADYFLSLCQFLICSFQPPISITLDKVELGFETPGKTSVQLYLNVAIFIAVKSMVSVILALSLQIVGKLSL